MELVYSVWQSKNNNFYVVKKDEYNTSGGYFIFTIFKAENKEKIEFNKFIASVHSYGENIQKVRLEEIITKYEKQKEEVK